MKKSSVLVMLISLAFLIVTGCSKPLENWQILKECRRNSDRIESIRDKGFQTCRESIAEAGITLEPEDDFRPTSFNGDEELRRLTGAEIRYITFLAVDGKFVAMIMKTKDNRIVYHGESTPPNISIWRKNFVRKDWDRGFAIYVEGP